MQRCPYIHEMKERLLGQQPEREAFAMESLHQERDNLLDSSQNINHSHRDIHSRQSDIRDQVGTVVKCNIQGYGFNTSPAHQRSPLVPRECGEDFTIRDVEESTPVRHRYVHYTYKFPKNAKTSLFIITSLVYAMLLIVVCIAYVISDVTQHRIPVMYYEGFFTYLYGVSILFLLYVFCFLLQESTCCNSGASKPKPPKKEKVVKPKKDKKPKKEKEEKDGKPSKDKKDKDGKGGKPSPFQEVLPKKKRDLVREQMLQKHDFKFQDPIPEVEAPTSPKNLRKRKTTQDQSCGSFFLRVGAIAFGLGTMIYTGLEFGSFFEIPFDSVCHQILRGVNPLLQMIFTFMQMYFIFMNSRLNIHRFKVLARFGLMHIAATNLCVWIRTLVLESLKEITLYHQRRDADPNDGPILKGIREHALKHAGTVMGTNLHPKEDWELAEHVPDLVSSPSVLSKLMHSGVKAISNLVSSTTTTSTTTTENPSAALRLSSTSTTSTPVPSTIPSTVPSTPFIADTTTRLYERIREIVTTTPSTTTNMYNRYRDEEVSSSTTAGSVFAGFSESSPTASSTPIPGETYYNRLFGDAALTGIQRNITQNLDQSFESLDALFPQPLTAASSSLAPLDHLAVFANSTCRRENIMGTIVEDSTPYLFPFIIEYSLIGACVIYVMWKHIGRNPRYGGEEDLEHRLEVMLSRRAVALAQANSGRVDCVGASKGLFFGLLLLVGSLICLILFFVLVRHPQLSLLAIYLADVSHSAIIGFSLIAILIGFLRVKTLKFRCEEQNDLNDILLRISAFGIFTYSVFSIIAGSLNALENEPNMLVMITGVLVVLQVVLQLLFIGDVSRRRVHLPEHDRSKPGRQIVTFLLICNISMFAIYTFEAQKVFANRVQLDFYGFIAWSIIQRITLPLCIFHRFHSAVTLAEIWKTTYKARLE